MLPASMPEPEPAARYAGVESPVNAESQSDTMLQHDADAGTAYRNRAVVRNDRDARARVDIRYAKQRRTTHLTVLLSAYSNAEDPAAEYPAGPKRDAAR